MTPQQYERLTELFHAALEIAPTERKIFLDYISESDAELRCELEALLAAEAAALTGKPPNDIAAGYLVQMGDCSATLPLLTANTRLDHYEIRSLLGKGGMGEVYLAEDIRLHRKVALKILQVEMAASDDRMRRFEQEAQAAATLNHPNIAHIYEIGKSENTHFIALEHIDGASLRDKIHRDKAPLQELLQYLIQVAEGLCKAHAAGIVHRDLKPDNIMITRDDYAKILDFGLAKLVEPQRPEDSSRAAPGEAEIDVIAQHSLAGTVMGTAGYMSPEQAQGKVNEIDQRSDIFSFGCILFEAVTGRKPFVDESVVKLLHKVVAEAAPPIKDLNPSLPAELQRIVSGCLAKDRDERYQTIKEVALLLKEVRQGMAWGAGPRSDRSETSRPSIDSSLRPASSVKYIAAEIKRHPRVAAIIFMAIVAAAGYGLYRFVGPKRPAASLPANKMTRLTATGKVLTGTISPDGKRVVYVVENTGQQSIWARQVATSSNVQIVAPSEAIYSNPSFTHDGNNIYFNKREKDGLESLYQMSVFGDMPRKVIEGFSARAALSPDEKRIAFIRGGFFESENSLVVANSNGSGEQVLATRKSPLNFYFGGIAWTPDGKAITCVAGPHAQKLIKVPLDGSAEEVVNTPNWFSVINIEWLPEGTGLIVAARESRTSPLQVWHLSYPSGAARPITNDFSNYTNLSLSADASALIMTKREATSHIWLAPEGDASRAKQLTTGTFRQDGTPSVNWTPDGRIIFDSTASGSVHTWIMNADGSDQRQLTDGAYEDQGAHVSHDGRYIVFTSNRTGTQHIYRMDIDGNNLKQLTHGADEGAPFFSPDGKWVIFSSNNYSSWRVDAGGGESVQLTNNSWASDISPDGKLVAHVRPVGAGSRLWKIPIIPFAGGPPLKTFDVRSDSRPNSRWTLDGHAIIYNLTHGGVLSGVTNLWIQPFDGSPPKQLTHFTSETFFSFDWSRDGKSLVCGRGTTSSDVVLITNFR
jgi:serine/threonine protein kinase/Tol biopolymer transport system component